MLRAVLDTSVLIRFWRRKVSRRKLADISPREVQAWAGELTARYGNIILTPVAIEFVAGATSAAELKLFLEFLSAFEAIDERRILSQDWAEAQRRAQRVPRNKKPRQLGDCLIAAIAHRLKMDVITHDEDFP
jgi:predicted nucleic acid-binding protein